MPGNKTYSFIGRIKFIKVDAKNPNKYYYTFDSDYNMRADDEYIYFAKEIGSTKNFIQLEDDKLYIDSSKLKAVIFTGDDTIFKVEFDGNFEITKMEKAK